LGSLPLRFAPAGNDGRRSGVSERIADTGAPTSSGGPKPAFAGMSGM
jgi:hypothetical protein